MPGTPKIQNEVAVEGVPPGQYRVIAWELDLTGRRLLDEICQISAYTPGSEFAQYVMPYRRPNPAAQHRHNIRIVSTGRYRVMKNNSTGKILKTKSEISALGDFLAWLETVRGKDGIILLSYESRTVISHILLESLRKYDLMEKFCDVVKGFANGFKVAEKKCAKAVNNNSLHSLSRLLLGKDGEMETSLDRARLTLEVTLHMCTEVREGGDKIEEHRGDGDSLNVAQEEVVAELCKHALSVNAEELELAALKALLVRQGTFRPIFGPMVQKNRRERQRASVQRQLIAEAGLDFNILEDAFKEKGKDGVAELMAEKMTNANSKVTEELLKLFMDHFDPPKEDAKIEQNGKEASKQGAKIEQNGKEALKQGAKIEQNGKGALKQGSKIEQNGKEALKQGAKIEQNGEEALKQGAKIEQNGKEALKQDAKIEQNGKEPLKQDGKADKTADDKTGAESPAPSDGVASTLDSPLSNISTPPGVDVPASLIASSPEK